MTILLNKKDFRILIVFFLFNLFFGCVEKEFVNTIGMRFIYIRPGSFMMGIKDEFRTMGVEEYKRVNIERGFYIQSTEATIGQWKKFIEATGYITDAEKKTKSNDPDDIYLSKEIVVLQSTLPPEKKTKVKNKNFYDQLIDGYSWRKANFEQTDQYPVIFITKKDVYVFIKWLNKREGNFYRLPTEAEWEYAARAGTTTHLPNGDLSKVEIESSCYPSILSEIGWYCYNSKNTSHPVAQKKPNPWGLYDMHGNVWEYVEVNSLFDLSKRYNRGGAWNLSSKECISGARGFAGGKDNTQGFRLVRDLRERKY